MKNPTKLWLLMLISAIVSILLFILLSIVTARLDDKGYDLNSLNRISNTIITDYENINNSDKLDIVPIIEDAHILHPEIRFEWISSNGTALYDTSNEYAIYNFEQLANRIVGMPQNLWALHETITMAYTTTHQDETFYLIISLSSDAMKQGQLYFFMRSFRVMTTFLVPLFFAFLTPYLLSLWFFYAMNKRISNINHAMAELNLERDIIVLNDKSKDEIGQLSEHYNAMAHRIQYQSEQIKQLERRRKQLLSNLSHDLRTPLTMILGYAETIRTGMYKDEQELQASAKVLLQRSRYMNKLLDQLLDITRQEDETYKFSLEVHNVSEMMRKIAVDYLLFLEGQDFTIEINIAEEDIYASIDASLIERAVRNLIDNAIRYGAEGKYLELTLAKLTTHIAITVIDHGPGILPKEQQLVFERFYRIDSSRKGDGLGIGLSIVKEIVEYHKGTIVLSSRPSNTKFEIHLPL